jgi:glycosyltransferase involved in cell wall biosynthesis
VKVTIAVGGKWCAFEQAEQLARYGFLQHIITSYPRSRIGRYKLARRQIVSLPVPELVNFGMRYAPSVLRYSGAGEYWKAKLFDRMVAKRLNGCNLFVGWAAFAKESMRIARSRGAVACVERGSAHILTQRKLLFEEYDRWGLRRPEFHSGLLERQLAEYENADFVIVQSRFAYRSFIENGMAPEKLMYIPLGVDPDLFRPQPKQDDKFRILFVGAMTLQKGILHLLEAFRALRLPRSELLFVGGLDPQLRPLLERWGGSFSLAGRVPHEQLPWWYSQASVVAVPSIQDGFGQVILEAMACGVPILASTHSCGPDVIRVGVDGYLSCPGSAEDLTEKLLLLYRQKDLLPEMGESARRRAEQFSWQHYGLKAVECFRRATQNTNEKTYVYH